MTEPIIELGPIKTLSPILTEDWESLGITETKSWTTEFLPMLIGATSPLKVAPYQTELFSPTLTFPTIVELGAIKSFSFNVGEIPLYDVCLNDGTNLSSLAS